MITKEQWDKETEQKLVEEFGKSALKDTKSPTVKWFLKVRDIAWSELQYIYKNNPNLLK
jgi:hypothetical protein